jgi:ribonuclease T1
MKKYFSLLLFLLGFLTACQPNAQNQARPQTQVQQDNNNQRSNTNNFDNQDDYSGKKGKKHHRAKGNWQSDNGSQASDNGTTSITNQGDIPAKVLTVLDYVLKNNEAPNGYVGGRNFGNFEGHLPKTSSNGQRIKYQEWDVNPKKQGKNRGTQRLITGSDGRNWYTDDHYATFKLVGK